MAVNEFAFNAAFEDSQFWSAFKRTATPEQEAVAQDINSGLLVLAHKMWKLGQGYGRLEEYKKHSFEV